MGVEQFVVVSSRRRRATHGRVCIGAQERASRVARIGAMCNVGEELMAGAVRIGEVERRRRVAFDQNGSVVGISEEAVGTRRAHHDLREAVWTLEEIAKSVGREQRHVEHVGIGEVDAQQIARLGFHHFPGGHAAELYVVSGAEPAIGAQITVGDQAAGGHWVAGGVELIGTQEHLVRRVRRIGLVLVNKRRGRGHGLVPGVVRRPQDAVGARTVNLGGAGQHHEVGRTARDIQRIIRLQRNKDRAVAALGQETQAVVEELTEEREPGVERRRQAHIRCRVGEDQGLAGWDGDTIEIEQGAIRGQDAQARIDVSLHGRGVADRLVDNQVADCAGLRVEHGPAGLLVGGDSCPRGAARAKEARRASLRRCENRCQHARKERVGGAELALVRQQVVKRTVDRAQAEGHYRVRHQIYQRLAGSLCFGDLDLLENELKIVFVE